MNEKKYGKYQFTGQIAKEEVINLFIKEKEKQIIEEVKENKEKLYKYKYSYKEYRSDNNYSFKNFSNCTGEKNNTFSLSNYEQVAYHDYRLVVPKLLMQALGTLEAIYLAELARLSMYKPVNEYGFFLASKKGIKEDTGMTARQQDPICDKLVTMGLIDTCTFKKQQRKFYRFNDDLTLEFYWQAYRKTIARTKYREQ